MSNWTYKLEGLLHEQREANEFIGLLARHVEFTKNGTMILKNTEIEREK